MHRPSSVRVVLARYPDHAVKRRFNASSRAWAAKGLRKEGNSEEGITPFYPGSYHYHYLNVTFSSI